MALQTDYTLITYNSFFTIVEMDSFIAAVSPAYGSDGGWSSLTTEDKESRTLLAVNYINSVVWAGTLNVAIIAPSMSWPRTGLTYSNGVPVDGDVTPDEIGNTMACWILSAIKGETAVVNSGQLKKKTVDKVTVEYTTDADFVEKTSQTLADTCLTTYAPPQWVVGLPGEAGPLFYGARFSRYKEKTVKGWKNKIDPKKLHAYAGDGRLEVGIFRDTQDYKDTGSDTPSGYISTIVAVAYIHEHGLGVVKRPWLERSTKADRKFYDKSMLWMFRKSGKSESKRKGYFNDLGERARDKIKRHIWTNDIGLAANEQSTIDAKGKHTPLIHNEHFVRHIDYRVAK